MVQKTVTAITNLAGRLTGFMLGKSRIDGKLTKVNSWYSACPSIRQLWTATIVVGQGLSRVRKKGLLSEGRGFSRAMMDWQ